MTGSKQRSDEYLVQRAVATIEDELERDVLTILEAAGRVGSREVNRKAERALSRLRRERKGILRVVVTVGEVVERRGVLCSRDENTD